MNVDKVRQYSAVNKARFLNICYEHNKAPVRGEGIGTLKEKRIHKVLKDYFDSNKSNQEIPHLGYVADIKNENGIIEIQTGSLAPLYPKLSVFLSEDTVTLVHPMIENKTLSWIDPQSGDISPRRRSPLHETVTDGLVDLYNIRSHLANKNLRIRLVFIDVDEYKYRDGWSRDRKKGAHRYERIPVGINSIVCLDDPRDYIEFIPDVLRTKDDGFTAKDYASAVKKNTKYAYYALTALLNAGAIKKTGKIKNSFVYTINSDLSDQLSENH